MALKRCLSCAPCKNNAVGGGRTSWDGDVVVAGFRAEHGAPAKCEVAISFMKWQEMELHAGLFDCSPRIQSQFMTQADSRVQIHFR